MRNFTGPLAKEMIQYIELLYKTSKYTRGIEGTLNELSKYILPDAEREDALSQDVIFHWDSMLTCSPKTRKRKYIELRGFLTYLQTLGFQCLQVQIPRTAASNYIPRIFDEHEWNRMVLEADNMASALKHLGSDMPIVFPMLIRLLYSCGLRVSEATRIKIKDIDFEKGFLMVYKSKRNRQRNVPMKISTTELLKDYCNRRGFRHLPENYIFACNGDNPPSQSWIQRWFSVLLERSEIFQTRTTPGERGICPHCLRHTFTYRSFHASADTFEDIVPFLSAYLGHENIRETDRYLQFSYEIYEDAHKIISDYTSNVFPEVWS